MAHGWGLSLSGWLRRPAVLGGKVFRGLMQIGWSDEKKSVLRLPVIDKLEARWRLFMSDLYLRQGARNVRDNCSRVQPLQIRPHLLCWPDIGRHDDIRAGAEDN